MNAGTLTQTQIFVNLYTHTHFNGQPTKKGKKAMPQAALFTLEILLFSQICKQVINRSDFSATEAMRATASLKQL